MANVSFKRGLHANLPWTSAVDGTFYLTTDTNRLYAAYGTNLVDLNQYIKIIATQTELEKLTNVQKGDFAYITEGNILAVHNGSTWVQINPDTNTDRDTKITNVSWDRTVTPHTDKVKGSIKLKLTITQTTYDIDGKEVSGSAQSFEKEVVVIDEDEFRTVVPVEVDVTASAPANNSTTISTTGLGSNGDGFTITGDETVKITGTQDAIVISVDPDPFTYDLNAATADNGNVNLNLTDGNSKDDTVQFAAGLNLNVKVETPTDDEGAATGPEVITYSHDAVSTATQTGTQAPTHEKTFTAVESITTSNGHVTGVKTTTYTLPKDNDTTIESVAVEANNEGRVVVTLTDSNGKQIPGGESNQDLYYTIDSGKYYNQAELPVYTRDQIDAKFKSLSGVTYIDTIQGGADTENATTLPTTPAAGDMYKVSAAGYFKTESNKIEDASGVEVTVINAEVGDVFIATGEETDGTIPLGSVVWTYIPSGDDTDSQYSLVASPDADQVFLRNTTTGSDVGSFMIKEGTAIDVTTTADESGKNAVIEISHEDVTNTNNSDSPTAADLEHEGTFTVVDGVTVNDQGHVTNVNYKKFTLPEDNDTTYTLKTAGTGTSTKLVLEDSNSEQSYIQLSGLNKLSVVAGTKTDDGQSFVQINHAFIQTAQSVQNSSSPDQLNYGDTFIIPYNYTSDNYGHITNIAKRVYKLPASDNTTYTLSGALTTTETADTDGYVNSFTMTDTLTDSANAQTTSAFNVKSSTLKCKVEASTNSVDIDLVWGTF